MADLKGTACGNCSEPLPTEIVRELASPGRFGVCPKCGIFLWSGDTESQGIVNSRLPSASGDVTAKSEKKAARRE